MIDAARFNQRYVTFFPAVQGVRLAKRNFVAVLIKKKELNYYFEMLNSC